MVARISYPAPMHKAFLPGAGLGTRLRPLTDHLPKPLVPLFHRPLVMHVLDACRAAGLVKFAINTHHLPESWAETFPPTDPCPWQGENGVTAWQTRHAACPVTLFHEPILLETGGGLRNIREWIGRDGILVHNADIFSTQPLRPLIDTHLASGLPVTLALRPTGPDLHVAIDSTETRVTDIRERLGRAAGTHQFTGVYCVAPAFLELLPAAEPVSVIPAFLALARVGKLGCVVIDEGVWLDLGTPATALAVHLEPPVDPGVPRIHPLARIDPAAEIDEKSWVGPDATVAAGVVLRSSWVFPGTSVAAGRYERSILLPDGSRLSA